MPSSGRHILDITKKGPSRGKARAQMKQMFDEERTPKLEPRAPRPTRLRIRRRNKRILVACACVLSTLILVGGLAGISYLPALSIHDVSVAGAEALQPEALTASVQAGISSDRFRLFSRSNMFLYPKRTLEATLSNEFPRIKDVSVGRPSMLAQAIVVSVEERKAYAKWCSSNCYLLDPAGFVFAEVGNEAPEIAYQFYGGLATDRSPVGQWFLRGRLVSIIDLLNQLATAGYVPASLTVDTEKDFTVALQSGLKLYISFDTDTTSVLRNLKTTAESDAVKDKLDQLQYIDLRFGNRVYFK